MDVCRITGEPYDYRIKLKAKFAIVVGLDDASMTENDWRERTGQFAMEVGFSGKLMNLVKKKPTGPGGFRPSGEYAAAFLFESGNSGECSRIFQRSEPFVHMFANYGNEVACAWVKLIHKMDNPNSFTTSTQWARSSQLHRTAHRDRWVFLPPFKNGEIYIRWIIQSGEPYNDLYECSVHTYGTSDPLMCDTPVRIYPFFGGRDVSDVRKRTIRIARICYVYWSPSR